MSHRRQWARGVGNSLGLPQPRLGRHEKDTGEEEVVQGGGSGRFLVVPNLAPATVPFPSAALHAPSQEAQADPILSGLARGCQQLFSGKHATWARHAGSDRPGSTLTTWTPALFHALGKFTKQTRSSRVHHVGVV